MGKKKAKSRNGRREPRTRTASQTSFRTGQATSAPAISKKTITASNKSRFDLNFFMPIIAALLMVSAAVLSLVYDRTIAITSLVLGLIGLLGTLSPKTPMGRLIFKYRLLSNKNVAIFFVRYRQGIINLVVLIVLIISFLIFAFLGFSIIYYALVGSLYLSLIMTLLFLFRKEWNFAMLTAQSYKWFFILTIILLSASVYCSHLVRTRQLEAEFARAKANNFVYDDLLISSKSINEYSELFEEFHRLNIKATVFVLYYQAYRQDYDLWGPVSWKGDDVSYVVTDDSISVLRQSNLPNTLIQALEKRVDQRFIGHVSILNALNADSAKLPMTEYEDTILKNTISSPQRISENEFKDVWERFVAISPPRLVEHKKQDIENSVARSRWRIIIFPTEIQPEYLTTKSIEVNLYNHARLVAVSKTLIINIGLYLFDMSRIILGVASVLVAFWFCYVISIWITNYNRKYDPLSDQSNVLFFILVAVISFAIGLWTW